MSFHPRNTSGVAAGAVLAAILRVALGGIDDGTDPSAPIRTLGRACEIAERANRSVAVHGRTLEASCRRPWFIAAGAA
jgi:hypothetical protein